MICWVYASQLAAGRSGLKTLTLLLHLPSPSLGTTTQPPFRAFHLLPLALTDTFLPYLSRPLCWRLQDARITSPPYVQPNTPTPYRSFHPVFTPVSIGVLERPLNRLDQLLFRTIIFALWTHPHGHFREEAFKNFCRRTIHQRNPLLTKLEPSVTHCLDFRL